MKKTNSNTDSHFKSPLKVYPQIIQCVIGDTIPQYKYRDDDRTFSDVQFQQEMNKIAKIMSNVIYNCLTPSSSQKTPMKLPTPKTLYDKIIELYVKLIDPEQDTEEAQYVPVAQFDEIKIDTRIRGMILFMLEQLYQFYTVYNGFIELLNKKDDDKGSAANIMELFAMIDYLVKYENEELKTMLQALSRGTGGSADFKWKDAYFDPFTTPVCSVKPENPHGSKTHPIILSYMDWFGINKAEKKGRGKHDKKAFPKHASGKGVSAKALLDITLTPKDEIEFLIDIFKEKLDTLTTEVKDGLTADDERWSDIKQMRNTYVVFYASVIRQDVVRDYQKLKKIFDTARVVLPSCATKDAAPLNFDISEYF